MFSDRCTFEEAQHEYLRHWKRYIKLRNILKNAFINNIAEDIIDNQIDEGLQFFLMNQYADRMLELDWHKGIQFLLNNRFPYPTLGHTGYNPANETEAYFSDIIRTIQY